jgi:alkane 1-monooxygenase
MAGFAWAGGPRSLAFFLAQGVIAAATLEVINYVEHYGLERRLIAPGRYERVTHRHSWNAPQRYTNWLLFNLQRHSDHHAVARRRYQVLRHHDDSPQLPAGYATMFVLALVPPLWRRVMNPRALACRAPGETGTF